MKLLRIHIRNLNSLRGDQEIDFTTAPLAHHQLYAIVGPTGAGKTTILDAITLALYGQTERNKSEKDRKDGSGSVMTYGEGECRAEVEYETAAGRFKSAWSRQRAHKRPDRDLTASRREVAKWNPETEDWDILATRKREVDEKTEEVVGLDYERFVRSVMLTQGDFARFLKSDPGDKAAILEKITGTAIYRDLSIAAFQRAKAAREAHERATEQLGVNQPLASEQRTNLDAEYAKQQARIKPLRERLTTLLAQLRLHDNLAGLRGKEAAAATEQQHLAAAWDAFAADRARLEASEALRPHRADLDAELRLAGEEKKLADELETTEREAGELAAAVEQAKAAVVAANEKLNEHYAKDPGRKKLFAEIAELEREITGLSRDAETDRKRKASLAGSLREQRAAEQKLSGEAENIRKELAGMEPAAIQGRLAELDGSNPANLTKIEALNLRHQWQTIRDRLAVQDRVGSQLAKEVAAAEAVVNTSVQALAVAEQALADRRAILNNLQVSASLSEHKTNLAPGEECPVCGATEHPGLEGFVPVTESAVERAQRDATQALTAEGNARRQLEAARQQLSAVQRKHEGQRTLVAELRNQLGDDKTAETESAAVLEQQLAAAREQLAKDTAEQTKLRRLQTNLPRLTELETQLTGVRNRLAELAKELTAVEGQLDKAETAIAKKQSYVREQVGERTAEQCREAVRKEKEKFTAELAAAEKNEVDAKGRQSTLASRRAVLAEQHERTQRELAAVRARLMGELGPRGITIAGARQTLLPENETAHLRSRQEALKTERATAATVAANLATEIKAATAALTDVPARDVLEKERDEAEAAVSTADRLVGALQLQIEQDDARIAGVAAQKEALEGLRKEADRWERLNLMIGSADGKKFRSYAQAITLQQLIAIGNDHLASINPRYKMEYEAPEAGAAERLEMIIVDQYQNDNRRTMATLSGGESFLISLALALGLSDLASGKSLIQSLFIDEGFGTLDGKTLDQAMTTLEQIQAQGKTIGLISHVPQLRERIQCQIRLERVGDGYSSVTVVG